MKNVIICLLGEDKTGKSHLSNLLYYHYNKKGVKVVQSWMRGSHTLASIISRQLSKLTYFQGSGNPYYNIKIPKKMTKIWWFLEYISILPVIIKRVIIPYKLGYTVIADRYIHDFIIWVQIITSNKQFINTIYAKHLLALNKKNVINIYITADIREIQKRTNDNVIYLELQKKLYSEISNSYLKIDTSNITPKEAMNKIIIYIRSLKNERK